MEHDVPPVLGRESEHGCSIVTHPHVRVEPQVPRTCQGGLSGLDRP